MISFRRKPKGLLVRDISISRTANGVPVVTWPANASDEDVAKIRALIGALGKTAVLEERPEP